METISNEEKAREIAKSNGINYKNHSKYEDDMDSTLECYKSAMEAMEWKEKQFADKCKEFCNRQTIGEYYNRLEIFQIDKYIDDMLNFNNFASVADIIRNIPDDWLQVMHSLNEKEKLLSAMFPELNNSEEWWNDFYNQFYE